MPAPLFCGPQRTAVADARKARSWRRQACSLGALLCAVITVSPASAQIAGTLSVESDYRVRGYSISGKKPALTGSLSYDDPSGVYASATAIGALSYDNHPDLLGAVGDVGYARRVTNQLSLDVGISRTQYFHAASSASGDLHYTEIYGGLVFHGISAHAYLSPDYLNRHVSAAYAEVDALLKSIGPWDLSGHVGVLGYLSTPRYFRRNTQYDWRLGVSRHLGAFDIHAAVTGGGPGNDYYRGNTHSKTSILGGVGWTF